MGASSSDAKTEFGEGCLRRSDDLGSGLRFGGIVGECGAWRNYQSWVAGYSEVAGERQGQDMVFGDRVGQEAVS